jgi:hypothetical protein
LLLLCLFYLSAAFSGPSEDTDLNLADIQLNKGEAAVWYLYHAGWAVKTISALLIFDYWELFERTEGPSLFNGFVDPSDIKDQ